MSPSDGIGPFTLALLPKCANSSAISLPSMLLCPGTHRRLTLFVCDRLFKLLCSKLRGGTVTF